MSNLDFTLICIVKFFSENSELQICNSLIFFKNIKASQSL